MKTKVKIGLAVFIGIVLIGGWFIWSSYTQKEPLMEKPAIEEEPIKQTIKQGVYITPTIKQGVYGVVRGTPYRGMPLVIEPGTPPQPIEKIGPLLPNITIQIREYSEKDQRAGKIVASTTTDKNGFYEITLPQGSYFLVIVDANIDYVLFTTGYQGKNFSVDERINTYIIIHVNDNKVIEQNITIPQSWPE